MSAWWTGAALGFDFESDGPVPTEARAIECGLVLVTPGNPPQEMGTLIQPERDIPQEAIDVHHITTERAKEEGQLREVAIAQIAMSIAELAGEHVPVVCHNAPYDLTLLDREMRRLGIGRLDVEVGSGLVLMWIGGGQFGPFPVIDTLVLDKAVDPYRRGKRKLEVTAEHYGVPMQEGSAHGATADVYAALRIAWRMSTLGDMAADYIARNGEDPMVLRMHPLMKLYGGRRDPLDFARAFGSLAVMSLTDLHTAQVGWKAEQQRSLRDYFAKQGNKEAASSVSEAWPLEPMGDDDGAE